jgi:hypothetical protein
MTIAKARSALLVPHSIKQVATTKTQSNAGKIDKHCTHCGMTNHNVETWRKNKEQTTMATTKATQPSLKPQKTSSYACHMRGLNGHKMTNCPKFVEMYKTFHGKFVVVGEVQRVVKK